MHVLIINFRLEGMDEEGYRAAGAELAPAFADISSRDFPVYEDLTRITAPGLPVAA